MASSSVTPVRAGARRSAFANRPAPRQIPASRPSSECPWESTRPGGRPEFPRSPASCGMSHRPSPAAGPGASYPPGSPARWCRPWGLLRPLGPPASRKPARRTRLQSDCNLAPSSRLFDELNPDAGQADFPIQPWIGAHRSRPVSIGHFARSTTPALTAASVNRQSRVRS